MRRAAGEERESKKVRKKHPMANEYQLRTLHVLLHGLDLLLQGDEGGRHGAARGGRRQLLLLVMVVVAPASRRRGVHGWLATVGS